MLSQGKIQKLDQLIEQILRQYGIDKKIKECEISSVWEEVVGRMIASKTKSIRMNDGKLFVKFSSSVVKNELMLVKEGLISALNERVGAQIVKELIII